MKISSSARRHGCLWPDVIKRAWVCGAVLALCACGQDDVQEASASGSSGLAGSGAGVATSEGDSRSTNAPEGSVTSDAAGSATSTTSPTGGDPATDVGSGEESSSSGDSSDPCGGADIVCDDFEDGLDAIWAYTGAPGNMPNVDDTVARSGSQSLTFPSTDTQGAFVYPTRGLPTADNRVFARAYVRFAQPMAQMGGHVSYLVAADAPSNGAEMRLGASTNFGSGDVMVDVNLLGSGPEYTQFSNGAVTGGEPSDAPGVVLDANTWYCIEATFDGANDEFRLSIDGAEISAMHVTDWQQGVTGWSPMYSVLKIGGQNYSGALGQVWFDDVAVSSSPIGCAA
ncbi:MAG: hypothetical protein ACRBN8_32940 [Nannocystales bacterium]